jgi:hypothetical protein
MAAEIGQTPHTQILSLPTCGNSHKTIAGEVNHEITMLDAPARLVDQNK